MRIERVVLNAPLDDATFGNPARPRPRRELPGLAPRAPASTASNGTPGPAPQ
jgi:hypothetical protein